MVGFAFSLGFKVDVVNIFGYSRKQLDQMSALVIKYNLIKSSAGEYVLSCRNCTLLPVMQI
jgi:hypothetical protein